MQSERHVATGLLLDPKAESLIAEIRSRFPDLRIFTPEELSASPELWAFVEIAYGGIAVEQIAGASNLKWLQLSSAGVNNWITPEVKSRGIIVTNARGIHAHPITEHMFGMLLAVNRRLPQAWDQQKTGQWRGYDFNPNLDLLAGKTLGILGAGAIGTQAARVGQAFGMRVIGLRRSGNASPFLDAIYTPETRLDFFCRSNVVMNILPGTPQTRGFMGPAEFDALPDGAVVINAGRGNTIDTPALLENLNNGRLKAALLDVTDPEPLPQGHPLWTHPNVMITPHYSGGHPGYMRRANKIFLDNLARYFRGETLINLVDAEAGY